MAEENITKTLILVFHNPRSLCDIYWDTKYNILYREYKGILKAKYKLEEIK